MWTTKNGEISRRVVSSRQGVFRMRAKLAVRATTAEGVHPTISIGARHGPFPYDGFGP
jgi:hypothetical protein